MTLRTKLKANEKVRGELIEVDEDNAHVKMKGADGKEFVQPVNATCVQWIEMSHEIGDLLEIGFDGVYYDVDEIEAL